MIQITNASLPDIQGAIGAGIDDGGWISTSYLVAEIVAIPLTGFLAPVFSLRRYLLASTVLFLVMSVACAFAAAKLRSSWCPAQSAKRLPSKACAPARPIMS